MSAIQNIEAEQALLGAILVNNEAMLAVSGLVQEEDFSETIHGEIFSAMGAMCREARAVTPITLLRALPQRDIGGLTTSQYLARLASEAASVVNAPEYARTISEAAARRRIIEVAQTIQDEASKPGVVAPMQLVERAVSAFMALDLGVVEGVEIATLDALEAEVVRTAQDVYHSGAPAGLSTGMSFVDEITGPLEPGDLVVVGGRSGAGKTAFALQMLAGLAKQGVRSTFFSLEMAGRALAQRSLSAASDVPASAFASGALNLAEIEAIEAAHEKHAHKDVEIIKDNTGRMSMTRIEVLSSQRKAVRKVGAIAIDHLQLIAGESMKGRDTRFDTIQDAVFRAKVLANRLGIVVILLSQLKRDDEETSAFRSMKSISRPRYNQLYGGDQINQAADKLLLVHRPITQLERMTATSDEAQAKLDQAKSDWQHRAEVILEKRRNGPAPRRRVCVFKGETMKFSPLFADDEAVL